VTVVAPAGAVTVPTAVRLSRVTFAIVDANVVQGSAVRVDVSGSLASPVTLTLRYQPGGEPDGVPETALALHSVEPGVGSIAVAGSAVDVGRHTVIASISRSGLYLARRIAGQPPCSGAVPNDLAFFVGEWVWTGQTGATGRATVTVEPAGCAVSEFQNMRTDNREYHALLFYDGATGEWRRTAIDVQLTRTVLRGKREASRIILYSPDRTRRRVLEPVAPDRVAERDEESRDGGLSWTLVTGGEYRRP
jgi:hypothetical protein